VGRGRVVVWMDVSVGGGGWVDVCVDVSVDGWWLGECMDGSVGSCVMVDVWMGVSVGGWGLG